MCSPASVPSVPLCVSPLMPMGRVPTYTEPLCLTVFAPVRGLAAEVRDVRHGMMRVSHHPVTLLKSARAPTFIFTVQPPDGTAFCAGTGGGQCIGGSASLCVAPDDMARRHWQDTQQKRVVRGVRRPHSLSHKFILSTPLSAISRWFTWAL